MKLLPGSLASRFLLLLGAVLLVAIAALFTMERVYIMPALIEQENLRAGRELARIEKALAQNQDTLLAHARDWAHWDDTYAFVQGDHDSYASVNFSREMFEDMQDQLMVFFDEGQQVRWVAGIDPGTDAYTACPGTGGDCSWVKPVVAETVSLLKDAPESGVAARIAKPWPALVAVAPVRRTDRSGPSNGWLMKVRLMDQRLTGMLEEQTGLPVSITVAGSGSGAGGFLSLDRQPELLEVSQWLPTSTANLGLELETRLPRDRFQIIVRILHYALIWTAGLLILVIAMVLGLLAVLVLRPVRKLTRFTRQQQGIHSILEGGSHAKVPSSLRHRRDEIGTLARYFQGLLEHQYAQEKTLLTLSRQDPLTGLPNRRVFDARLGQALADPTDPDVSVMMVDIDHFKLYNDHYGHPAGDACLVHVAEGMQEHLGRQGFLVARTGGEEFNVLMPRTSVDQALEYAEGLCHAVQALALPHAASPVCDVVTVSIGVASTRKGEGRSGSRLMSHSDEALYQAKANGRNHVAVYGGHTPVGAT